VLLLFGRVGDNAEKLEGLTEGVFELVQVARPDKETLPLGNLMPVTVFINSDAPPPLDLDNMLIVMIMEGGVAARSNKEVAHYDVPGSVLRTNEYLHSYIGCTLHLHLRCENLFVVVYLHDLSSDFYSKLPLKHFREAKVLSSENEIANFMVSASPKS